MNTQTSHSNRVAKTFLLTQRIQNTIFRSEHWKVSCNGRSTLADSYYSRQPKSTTTGLYQHRALLLQGQLEALDSGPQQAFLSSWNQKLVFTKSDEGLVFVTISPTMIQGWPCRDESGNIMTKEFDPFQVQCRGHPLAGISESDIINAPLTSDETPTDTVQALRRHTRDIRTISFTCVEIPNDNEPTSQILPRPKSPDPNDQLVGSIPST